MTATHAPEETPVIPAEDGGGQDATPARRGRIGRWWWALALGIVAVIVVLAANFASSAPDGLERVAEDQGFIERATNFIGGLFSDYAIPGISDPTVSTILSGLLGVGILLLVVFVLGRVLARRRA
jgi:cobalt/nickel transport protein